MKYAIVTFGCRVNQADSQAVDDALRRRGAIAVPPDDADLVVVNSCSVTATADQGARQTIRRIARANTRATIVVTGCYATRAADEVGSLPGVVRVVPNESKGELVDELLAGGVRGGAADLAGDGPCGRPLAPGDAGRTVFTLRVQTGCNEPCSYCIIPTTRGDSRSMPVTGVLGSVGRATDAGFKEVVLSGVHLGAYGRDLPTPTSLAALLATLATRFPDVLFRVSSLEPMDCTPAVLDVMSSARCFAPHFHLPLQHASCAMLSAMRRPYRLADYARVVDRIRRDEPFAAIGSDIIVGFPGESDADHDELCAYLERSPLTHLHVFPYSDRPGTPASRLGARVDGRIVRQRGERVRRIGHELAAAFRRAHVGVTRRALTVDDGSAAVTDNYLKVRIPPGRPRNEWVDVRIEEIEPVVAGVVCE
ncbi:MAG: MiaB/RimO family radical SAM methylthiotransferase [Vicinamibacterales bacterium]